MPQPILIWNWKFATIKSPTCCINWFIPFCPVSSSFNVRLELSRYAWFSHRTRSRPLLSSNDASNSTCELNSYYVIVERLLLSVQWESVWVMWNGSPQKWSHWKWIEYLVCGLFSLPLRLSLVVYDVFALSVCVCVSSLNTEADCSLQQSLCDVEFNWISQWPFVCNEL